MTSLTTTTVSALRARANWTIRRARLAYMAAEFVMESAWNYCLSRRPDETLNVQLSEGGERRIRIDCFLPQRPANERRPAIILLHGVEGGKLYASRHYRTAAALAKQGYAVYYVHYFGSVDYEHLWLFDANASLDVDAIERICERDRPQWIATVTRAIEAVSERPEVDSRQIAMCGYSLGCFVSLSVAEELLKQDRLPKVAAVVGNWGAKFRDVKFSAGFPPTRLFHGTKDPVILLDWARETLAHLRAVGADAALMEIPRQGHRAHSRKAWRETLAFLKQTVMGDGCATRRLAGGLGEASVG